MLMDTDNEVTNVGAVVIVADDYVAVFTKAVEKVKANALEGYSIYEEKSSNSIILYNADRNSLKPIAVLAGGKVSPIPAHACPNEMARAMAGVRAAISFTPA